MKYLSEYRNPELVKQYITELHKITTKPWNIMEICGGQTHSLVKNGLLDLLPSNIRMIHGPGCPVCVTPISLIDKAIELMKQDVILCSFGDMTRVPGSSQSLLQAKAEGGDLRILYSPLEAVNIAAQNPDREIVFFAVGFETTAPSIALAVIHAQKLDLDNFSLLVSHVLVPPAMETILSDEFCTIDAFLGAGHVCTIVGLEEYYPISAKYKIPIVISGFEPADLLRAIYHAVLQLEEGKFEVENQYTRLVKEEGNVKAKEVVDTVFTIGDQEWRSIGVIENSGLVMRENYRKYDANSRFSINSSNKKTDQNCIAGEILRGTKKPNQCPEFGKKCKPSNPLGAPMVSSEGACAAYYNYL
ncbi:MULTISPECIES: hydrogenase formation protein HypD [unclassified Flavobacterium]|uniref:hydrogenase formation protein HypD n=1 Tax=unclassified Flavobacterium TaxID=196869 RepID=UPI000580AF09|nr:MULTISPECIES: hydrogenase formation protein HypD [unclassified Flavobacterium]KIC00174.1 hydrogenase formation protein HupD [Flavobacterium sp. KMS]MEA9411843.1 hydrogenase formation protein HypD [Flavobacterium sp. PL02]